MSKKNKKSFSEGLEDMFQTTLFEDNPQDDLVLLKKKKKTTKKAKSPSKTSSKKSFASNLEAFFQDTIEEVVEEKKAELNASKERKKPTPKRRNSKKPVIGIDLLIRNTLETATPVVSDKKRITFTFNRENVERLREISKLKKERVRNIVEELITEYIEKWEKEN